MMGIPDKLFKLIKITMMDSKAASYISSSVSKDFNIEKGVRQRDELSTIPTV